MRHCGEPWRERWAGRRIGRFGGRWAIEEFTTDHWISVQHQPLKYPI
jgi:hypothetical protein